ncbi:MaoC/PaaZ C-terminal domain-containing protein [Streptomyces sp. NBC_01285]|uniref:MaoC family dehydratase n=1 Tax=Streptomyces sp. NBC_01285 TaxID=2903813 RepID=UPI00224F3E21|nr:MaoC/PaaZ C-terminal domain-containing protein [Streptomyces sp. NBC_01285]MCX4771843.1 MaoC/PaaZ C-terminal domain-containing protein [Streptomyces sp. NBC_01285]
MASLILSLARGAATSPFKRAGRPNAALPADRATRPAAPVAARPLAAYRRICGFADPGALPVTYPHVLAFPLAMRLMTRRRFPLPVTGLVHTWIEITAHRVLHPTDELELTVYAAGLTPHRRGTEVTVVTEARLSGELVWESRSGYLSRHATRTGTTAKATGTTPETTAAPPPAAAVALPAIAEWRLPADLGRRYGAASGDRNPIHLYPLTARLFGFPRAIAHGMWTVARCLAEAPRPHLIHTVRADFKAPVLLPGTVTYASDGTGFQLRDGSGDNERIHLTGTAAPRTGD